MAPPARAIVPAVLAAALLAAAPAAASGPYLALHGGPNFLQDTDLDLDGGRIEPDYNVGYHFGGALGYAFGAFRIEAEVGFQRHGIGGGSSSGVAPAVRNLDGGARILSFLINGVYDIDLGHPLKPFVGAGAGVARVRLNGIEGTVDVAGVPTRAELIDDVDTALALQAMAGVSFDVDERWTTAFGYRFFAALGAEFDVGPPLGGSAEADFFSHALRFEARYRF